MGNAPAQHLQVSPVDGSAKLGRSCVYRNALFPDELVDNLLTTSYKNIWDIFQHSKTVAGGHADFIGCRNKLPDGTLERKFTWISRNAFEALCFAFASGVTYKNLAPLQEFEENANIYPPATRLAPLGIFMKNRVEWFVVDYATAAYDMVLVPLYDTLGEEAINYILNQTRMTSIVATPDCLNQLIKCKSQCLHLQNVILMDKQHVDEITDDLIARAMEVGLNVHLYSELLACGRKHPVARPDVSSDRVWTLSYTSGTTAEPKGVILTHHNYVAVVCAALRCHLQLCGIDETWVHLSYLPLQHIFERMISACIIASGGSVGVYSGDTMKLIDDAKLLEPTLFISVPRVYNRINDKVLNGIQEKSALVQKLFQRALDAKLKNLRETGSVTHAFWDTLVFNKVRSMLGSRLSLMLTGGAPLDPAVQERMKVMFCVPFLEGYGMTESLGCSFMTNMNDTVTGFVGINQPCLEWCIESVAEMDYHVSAIPPCGELLMRGHAIMKGYFCNEMETMKCLDEEGFLHSGDIVAFHPKFGIKIVDRKKNIFKLAQGEYVAPERIEQVYQNSVYVGQIFVYGYSTKNFLIAIIVPEQDTLVKWADKTGLSYDNYNKLIENPKIYEHMRSEMEKEACVNNLKGFEKVKQFYCSAEPFSVENGLCTPTMKLKREAIKNEYSTIIDKLYNVASA